MPKPDPNVAIEASYDAFIDRTRSVLYGTGARWFKSKFDGFSPASCEYMRELYEGDGVYMYAIDFDSLVGLNAPMLQCAKEVYTFFGSTGLLKASGVKGIHVIPFKIRFPHTMDDYECRTAMRDMTYTAARLLYTKKRHGIPFLGRTSSTSDEEIRVGYMDAKMYTKGRMVRGFCRRFDDKGTALKAWSVPVEVFDTLETIEKKVALEVEPNWDYKIPTIEFDRAFIKYTVPDLRQKIHAYRRSSVELKGSDTLESIMNKMYEAMPPALKRAWDAHDPSHNEKFAVVTWLNQELGETVEDQSKRADLIANLLIKYMPLETYRSNGRFSESTVCYQVGSIVGGEYLPPAWIWED